MKYFWMFVFVFCLTSKPSQGAVLVEENNRMVNQSYAKEASEGLEFRNFRRFGVGISTAGALGLVGANLEINFTPQTSFMGGFGLGDKYQS